ncbi:MAG: hypothetical protein IPM54_14770 [Polyangiaceae bacterium]|nr:hypothetical protein [Polyangiaceae bacterium]
MDSLIIEWDQPDEPSAEEVEGIRQAMESLDAGRGLPFDEVMEELEAEFGDS